MEKKTKKFIIRFYRCSPDGGTHTISKLVKVRKLEVNSDLTLEAVQLFACSEARTTFPVGDYLVVTSYCGTPFICSDTIFVF